MTGWQQSARAVGVVGGLVVGWLVVAASCSAIGSAQTIAEFEVSGDAIAGPLGGARGDVEQGRRLVLDRARGNCLICHVVPEPSEPFMGEIGPNLTGIGGRLSVGQIRLRVVDQARLNPLTVMPPYHRVGGLRRVGAQYRDRPVLSAGEIEHVVAYLASLK